MQTFLPHPDFIQSLKCLDRARLGKQRVEAMQLVNALTGKSKGWSNHPAAKMWEGYLPALKLYHDYAIAEWVLRGYNNTMKYYYSTEELIEVILYMEYPPWLGDQKFHESHQSNLLRKANEALQKAEILFTNKQSGKALAQLDIWQFYQKISLENNWIKDSTLPYIWPTP